MSKKTYTMAEITKAWDKFKGEMVYRCLVNGRWVNVSDYQAAKRLSPVRIEVRKAKDISAFPEFLEIFCR